MKKEKINPLFMLKKYKYKIEDVEEEVVQKPWFGFFIDEKGDTVYYENGRPICKEQKQKLRKRILKQL